MTKRVKPYKKKCSAKAICERTQMSIDLLRTGSWLKPDDLTVFSQVRSIAVKVEAELDELIVTHNELLLKDAHSSVAKAAGIKPKKEKTDGDSEDVRVVAKRAGKYK